MPIVWVSVEGLHTNNSASAVGDNKADFISKFIRFIQFALTYTLYLRSVKAINYLILFFVNKSIKLKAGLGVDPKTKLFKEVQSIGSYIRGF